MFCFLCFTSSVSFTGSHTKPNLSRKLSITFRKFSLINDLEIREKSVRAFPNISIYQFMQIRTFVLFYTFNILADLDHYQTIARMTKLVRTKFMINLKTIRLQIFLKISHTHFEGFEIVFLPNFIIKCPTNYEIIDIT